MSPKARSTVRPFSVRPDASLQEQAHARGLNEGMLRKVNRIKQEVSTRQTLATKLVKKIGLRDKRIAELEREVKVLRFWIARITEAQDHDRDWKGLGSWTREALRLAISEADATHKAG